MTSRPPRTSRLLLVTTLAAATATAVALTGPSVAHAAGSPSRFVAIAPCRLLDTRATTGAIAAGGTVDVQATGARCNIPSGASAIAGTVTAVSPNGPGFVAIWPTGAPRPDASALNYRPAEYVANSQPVQPSGDGRVAADVSAGHGVGASLGRRSRTRTALPCDRSTVPGASTRSSTLTPISDLMWCAASAASRA